MVHPKYRIAQDENYDTVVVFNAADGTSQNIKMYYKNGFYYNEIVYLGEDWFAGRFGETWYLVQP